MVLRVAWFTWSLLLIVRHTVQDHAQQELTADVHSSLLMLDRLQKDRQLAMRRKADLLATSAYLSNNDPTSFADSTSNPLDTSKTNLITLADSSGTIIAFRTSHISFLPESAAAPLHSSLKKNRDTDWWFNNGHLYQVVLQPIGPVSAKPVDQSGAVVVGKLVGSQTPNPRMGLGGCGRITSLRES
jgi:hypothetical protein